MSEVDYADVQGLVRFGYGKMTRATYVLVRVKDLAAARTWFGWATITSALEMTPPPETALNMAFTAAGLRELKVSDTVIAAFSHEFRGGMAQESRARQLGDVGRNAPSGWRWGNGEREPHAVIMFFAAAECFEPFLLSSKGSRWNEAFEEVESLETSNLNQAEPFGFADGISQPGIDWEQTRKTPCAQFDYTNFVALGEFLLGYPNEYGKLTERPLLDADAASAGLLPAEEEPAKRDLGRNGTYLVLRQLEQDVRTFWKFAYEQAGGSAAEAATLAAAMVGRTTEGDPLVPIQPEPIEGTEGKEIRQNQFTYDGDPAGARCPFGAHVRRANPRNTDFPGRPAGLLQKVKTMLGFGPDGFRDDLMSSVRFHRILRRGREYGDKLKPEDALTPAPTAEESRGLNFICLNASISRQFEFLQNAWMSSTKFSGLTGESDPLLGNRQPFPGCPVTSNFTRQQDGGVPNRITDLPQFVTVRGGAYFFLPSLRAIRYIAATG